MSSEKTILPSLRNIEWKTLKIETDKMNPILHYIPTNNITELNELFYEGAKLVCEKIGIPSKSTKKQSKPRWEIRLETQIKKTTKTSPKDKKERRWNKREKGTGNMGKNTTWGNKPDSTAQRKKIKEISTKSKTTQKNRTFQNNERKFYQQLGGSDTKTYQQLDIKETERFWTKIWQPKKHNENAEWINNITRELEGLQEGAKMEIHIDLLKTTQKVYQTGKRQAIMEYMASGSRNSPPFTAD